VHGGHFCREERSEVRSITVIFSTVVNLPTNPADAFVLTQTSLGSATVGLVADSTLSTSTQTVVRLTFTGTDGIDGVSIQKGPAIAGRRQIQAHGVGGQRHGGERHRGAPRRDSDRTAGGDYVSPPDTTGPVGSGYHYGLYRLFGDATGDGTLDAFDAGQLRVTFNSFSPDPNYMFYFDANNDVTVDAIDVGQFRSRFNVNFFP
jgi:Dockerin type I domain